VVQSLVIFQALEEHALELPAQFGGALQLHGDATVKLREAGVVRCHLWKCKRSPLKVYLQEY
jgi:hypothetical protein